MRSKSAESAVGLGSTDLKSPRICVFAHAVQKVSLCTEHCIPVWFINSQRQNWFLLKERIEHWKWEKIKIKQKHQVRVHRFGGGIFVAWDPCTFKESAGQMVGLTLKCRPPAPLDQHSWIPLRLASGPDVRESTRFSWASGAVNWRSVLSNTLMLCLWHLLRNGSQIVERRGARAGRLETREVSSWCFCPL